MKLKIPTQLFREGTATLEGDAIRLSISSDAPYLRYNWADDSEYFEVLDHSNGGVDLSRLSNGAALLFNHKRDIQLGTINSPTLENGRCYVQARMSDAPDVSSYKTRVQEGILKDTSIGYEITDDGTCIGEREGKPVYKFKFAIHEASLVTIPADPTVGLGRCRSEEPKCGLKEIGIDLTQLNCNKPTMTKSAEEIEAEKKAAEAQAEADKLAAEKEAADKAEADKLAAEQVAAQEAADKLAAEQAEAAKTADVEAAKAGAVTAERQRAIEIQNWARDISNLRKIDLRDACATHIADGKTLAEFKEWVLANEFKSKPLTFETPHPAQGQSMKRDAFDKLSPHAQSDYCKNGGKITD